MHATATLLAIILPGCELTPPVNPSFSVPSDQAKQAIAAMKAHPVPLARPLIVLGGYLDFVGAAWVAADMRRLTGDARILWVQYPLAWSFEDCRDKVIAAVDEEFPTTDPHETVEVDVIGVSMGGIVARYAALPPAAGGHCCRRLRLHRLFTLSSPHRGASWASLPSFHRLHLDMRVGSGLLERLDEDLREGRYHVYPYTQLGDGIVGPANAAPRGDHPWWIPRGLFPVPHAGVVLDARVRADIARRLRGEAPFATEPRAPVPGDP